MARYFIISQLMATLDAPPIKCIAVWSLLTTICSAEFDFTKITNS